ncbi:unnamed protein product [Onchocerca ochengi]|uniref:Pecanex-like protein n=1 Tax=Onchocerca ochengi TaxID=42157 RepID=A0A182E8B8_ONCOC|nr:unnamed protein product [Onchocerca ochengi]
MNDSREQEGVHTKEQRERQLEPDENLASKNRKQGVPISKQCASKEDSPDGWGSLSEPRAKMPFTISSAVSSIAVSSISVSTAVQFQFNIEDGFNCLSNSSAGETAMVERKENDSHKRKMLQCNEPRVLSYLINLILSTVDQGLSAVHVYLFGLLTVFKTV